MNAAKCSAYFRTFRFTDYGKTQIIKEFRRFTILTVKCFCYY